MCHHSVACVTTGAKQSLVQREPPPLGELLVRHLQQGRGVLPPVAPTQNSGWRLVCAKTHLCNQRIDQLKLYEILKASCTQRLPQLHSGHVEVHPNDPVLPLPTLRQHAR